MYRIMFVVALFVAACATTDRNTPVRGTFERTTQVAKEQEARLEEARLKKERAKQEETARREREKATRCEESKRYVVEMRFIETAFDAVIKDCIRTEVIDLAAKTWQQYEQAGKMILAADLAEFGGFKKEADRIRRSMLQGRTFTVKATVTVKTGHYRSVGNNDTAPDAHALSDDAKNALESALVKYGGTIVKEGAQFTVHNEAVIIEGADSIAEMYSCPISEMSYEVHDANGQRVAHSAKSERTRKCEEYTLLLHELIEQMASLHPAK